MFYFVCSLIFVKHISYLSIQTVKFFARRETVSNLLEPTDSQWKSGNAIVEMYNVPHRQVFEHLIPSWSSCLGKLWTLKQVAGLAMVGQWELAFRVIPPSLSLTYTLFFSWIWTTSYWHPRPSHLSLHTIPTTVSSPWTASFPLRCCCQASVMVMRKVRNIGNKE